MDSRVADLFFKLKAVKFPNITIDLSFYKQHRFF